ncbi:hypothetical protein CKAH01_03333 [Colletotrichum kahawae]|uniref:Uncharacterized protein n=1 Tax=Colletotrichum kahawae TaxID=34407 RepID=A0AAE0DCZ1_COLKA|nr:hypothetical protein CKAH01_03333 [Colletotrichum kahawae]
MNDHVMPTTASRPAADRRLNETRSSSGPASACANVGSPTRGTPPPCHTPEQRPFCAWPFRRLSARSESRWILVGSGLTSQRHSADSNGLRRSVSV